MPPGDMTTSAASQQFDFKVLTAMVAPVLLMVWVYGGWSLINFHATKTDRGDGIPLRGNRKVQGIWYVGSAVLVLFLAGFGTYELINGNGVGTGEGPSPIGSQLRSTCWSCRLSPSSGALPIGGRSLAVWRRPRSTFQPIPRFSSM